MGIVQGLTEFLPISSSGHLIIVPFLFGWTDPFITSLAFSVMLHIGTLAALLVYFRADWVRLVPAGFATIRDRSFGADPDRRLAWLLVAATIPAAIAGFLLNDASRNTSATSGRRGDARRRRRHPVARRPLGRADQGRRGRHVPDRVRHRRRPGAGARAGHQPLGISISAARFAGLDREAAARFSFLMATPDHGRRRHLRGPQAGRPARPASRSASGRWSSGCSPRSSSGMIAIGFLLRYLRTRSLTIFVVYRLVLAAVVVVAWLR